MKSLNYNRLTENQSVSLDTLRGLAAVIVVICHCSQLFINQHLPEYYRFFAVLAQSCVMIFFVLSGFLITKSITGSIARNGSLDLKDYAVKRFARIYPPLVFSFIIVAVLSILSHQFFISTDGSLSTANGWVNRYGFDVDIISYVPSALMSNGFIGGMSPASNSPLWSLSIEVWYYVISGLILSGRKELIIAALAVGYVGISNNPPFFYYSVVWVVGAILCLMHDGVIKYSKLVTTAALLISAAYAFYRLAVIYNQFNNSNLMLANVSIGLFMAALMQKSVIERDLRLSIIPSMASFSYTLYIIHFPILLFVFGCSQEYSQAALLNALTMAGIGFVVSIATAYVSAKFVENTKFFTSMLKQKAA
ncbi:acyltransferase [Enterobacter cloacae]|uniref:acyltransferase family protein n=1 Tax=Enterobacter cloacae TaxID=550 RepID=UPI00298F2AEF|nr:acyltransferase [Enterobacter cloacae]MDW8497757.1 acyltransferase [Enterobacter cloacae subsp. cloacae]HBN6068648.1 acyltransferase [Enterobacter cloacae]